MIGKVTGRKERRGLRGRERERGDEKGRVERE